MLDTRIDSILQDIDHQQSKLLQLLVSIARIPSPTGHEQEKMQFIQETLLSCGLRDVSLDRIGNCIARLPGAARTGRRKTLLIVAHADTACDPGKTVAIREDEHYLYGHGVSDNSAGVTGLLTTIRLLQEHHLSFPHDLLFGFTVGEEGLGAKRGMKQLIKDYGKQVAAVINVESHHIGRVTNQAIGQYRCELTIDTNIGGHSFRDFGRPNANVILAHIISDFAHVTLPQTQGKTTFNVGQMVGEGSVNAIPRLASCLFEIRSEENNQLRQAREVFEAIVERYRKQFPAVSLTVKVVAETAAVTLPPDHPIYQITMQVQKALGIPSKFTAGNTDGDVSLAAGIPTVTIGTSEGWNTHSLHEYLEKKTLPLGVKQVFAVIYTLASSKQVC